MKRLWLWLRGRLWRGRFESELADELTFHVEMRADEWQRRGLDRRQAVRRARVELGGLDKIKDDVRAVRLGVWLDELVRDVRYGLRVLLRRPGFTIVAVLVLALGIGVNAGIFSFVNAVLLRPLPVPRPADLVGIYARDVEPPGRYRMFSYPGYLDIRERAASFEQVAAFATSLAGVSASGEATARRVFTFAVTDGYFETFGDVLAAGRDFTAEETAPRANRPVAVVSHGFWSRRDFDPDLVGQTVNVNGTTFTIVGITRQGFTGTSLVGPELWVPLGVYGSSVLNFLPDAPVPDFGARDGGTLFVVGRLRPGTSTAAANAELETLAAQLAEAHPDPSGAQTLSVAAPSKLGISTRPQTDREPRLLALLLSVLAAVVLLVACLNLANLLLARGSARRTEIAIRRSLGGGRARIVRQLLTEGLLLSLVGSAIGLVVAQWALDQLMASVSPLLPFNITIDASGLDGRVVAATFGFSLVATLAFGLGPAWALARREPKDDLAGAATVAGRAGRSPWGRSALAVSQLALSLALLTAGGLFIQGALRVADHDPGFSLDRGLLVETDAAAAGYDEVRGRQTYEELLIRLQALPGIEAAGAASLVPYGMVSYTEALEAVGRPLEPQARPTPQVNIVTDGYFDAVGLSILRGRDFAANEIRRDVSPDVVIVDETLARALWGDDDPLGQAVRLVHRATGELGNPQQVVGVVPGVRRSAFDVEPVPHVYVPFGHPYSAAMTVHLRTEVGQSDEALLAAVRDELRAFDPSLPIFGLTTLADHRDASLELWVIGAGARVFSTFGLTALLMAVIGIYGVKAYGVARRTREIGIRRALGATATDVVRLFVREGLSLTALGLLLGLALAFPLGRLLESLLVDVSGTDPVVLLVAPLLLAAAATLASYVPARRAARVAPMSALRQD